MTMSKIKGPWLVLEDRAARTLHVEWYDEATGGELPVCKVPMSEPEVASLIAAAPKLLQCLSNIVTLFESNIKRGAPAQLEAAHEAITEARMAANHGDTQ